MNTFILLFLAESYQGDQTTWECMTERKTEDLVKKEVMFDHFATSYMSLYTSLYGGMTALFPSCQPYM
jgi:hypothetical protein